MRLSGGGAFFLKQLPVPGQQLDEALCGMILKTREHVCQPGERIDVVELGGLCRPPDYAERVREEPVVGAHLRPLERVRPLSHSA
jgi:hypothetical protein